jgi:hypothetical protein
VPAASRFLLPFGLLLLALLPRGAEGATEPRLRAAHFTGQQSCASSGCHGGGTGKNQCLIWQKKDAHSKAHAILSIARSKAIAEAVGITDAAKDGRCTICHSPLQSVPAERMASGFTPEQGVSCETCHGPAEPWLRFHTRLDISRDQRLAAGMREMRDLYNRANTCVACHLYIDPELAKAGHPEMFFEMSRQMKDEPPHWREIEDQWLAPRAWQVGQSAALREFAWKLGQHPDEEISARVEGLRWLLRQSTLGQSQLPEDGKDPGATQAAADRLARTAAKTSWTKEATMAQLRKLADTSGEFRETSASPAELRRRAEVLVPAIDRFWQTLKATGLASPTFEQAYAVVFDQARTGAAFQPALFAAALQQVEVALEQLKQGTVLTEKKETAPAKKK